MFEQHNDNIHQPQTFNYKSSLMRAITSLFGVKPPQELSVNLKNNQHINRENATVNVNQTKLNNLKTGQNQNKQSNKQLKPTHQN